jgi:hypothetical protein
MVNDVILNKMHVKRLFLFCIIVALGWGMGCVERQNEWQPQTQILDAITKTDSRMSNFVHEVKLFYQNLHEKRWPETYEQRNQEFRKDFPMSLYLEVAQREGARWTLIHYEVLSVETHGNREVRLICKFVEGPGEYVTYRTITWRQEEDGKWRCDAAGPTKLSIFYSSRAPE